MIPSQSSRIGGNIHQVDEDLTETSLDSSGTVRNSLMMNPLTRDDSARSIGSTISTSVNSSLKVKTHRESLEHAYRTTTRSSESRASSSNNSVCFGSVEVSYYNLVLGSHPAVSRGPPIELGWNLVDQHQFHDLDTYEARHQPPREFAELALSPGRRELLLRQNGVKPYEIEAYEHQVFRQRMRLRMEQEREQSNNQEQSNKKQQKKNRVGLLKKQGGLRNLFRPSKRS